MAKFGGSDGGRAVTGVIVLAVGLFLLFRKLGMYIPDWLLSWPMIFVVIGVIVLAKSNLQSGFGLIMLLIGGFFLLKNEVGIPFGMEPYLVPGALIAVGLYLIFVRKKIKSPEFTRWERKSTEYQDDESGKRHFGSGPSEKYKSETGDKINSQAFFCGIKRKVLGQQFKGGKVAAFFGDTEIDLTQADLGDNALLDVEVAFGSVKLWVPSNWELKLSVDNIFASVEDKRASAGSSSLNPSKALVVSGTVIFGSLEFRSY